MSSDIQNPNTSHEAQAKPSAATLIERLNTDGASIIKQKKPCPTTLIESGTPRETSVGGTNLVVGAEIFGCTLREPMKVTSGEGNLWLADRQQQRVVIKVYREGRHPKAEVAALLKQADRSHVVTLLDRGILPDGRSVEVLEYISCGTLEALLPRAATDEAFRLELVREMAHALDAVHTAGLMHRDIKPANILVRTTQPLDLVLADFGISSITDLELSQTTKERTVPYSAPESTQGVVSKGSDWWSLGVILLEIFLGRHPFADLDDLMINVELVTRPMPLPKDLPARWRTLVAGLLTKDHGNRWKFEQVSRWLAGEENIPVYFETAATLTKQDGAAKPFDFEKQKYSDAASLAVALAKNPTEGAKRIERGTVSGWLAAQLGEHDMASQLEDLRENKQLKAAEKLALGVMVMNPELPLFINGMIASPDWLSENLVVGISLVEGPIPDWLQQHRNDRQYLDIRERRKNLHTTLIQAGIAYDAPLADRLAFSKPADVLAQAEQNRKSYARATIPTLDAALRESPLLELTAGILLAANRSQLIAWQQHFDEHSAELLKRLNNLSQLIDEPITTGKKLQATISGAEKLDRSFDELRKSCEPHLPIAQETTEAAEKLIDSCRSRAEIRLQQHARHQQLLNMAISGETITVRNFLTQQLFSDIDYGEVEKILQEWTRGIAELQTLIDEQTPDGPVAPKTSIFKRDVEFLEKQSALVSFLQQVSPQITDIENAVESQRGTEVFTESRLATAKLRRSFDWLRDFAKAQARA